MDQRRLGSALRPTMVIGYCIEEEEDSTYELILTMNDADPMYGQTAAMNQLVCSLLLAT